MANDAKHSRHYTPTIDGVPRSYTTTGKRCFIVYGKSKIQARYGAFGIVNGKIMQVKRLYDAMSFGRFDLDNAQKFCSLCKKTYPKYRFEVREFVRVWKSEY